MRNFLRCFKGLHIWLLTNVVLLLLFFVLRSSRAVMNAVSGGFSMPLERALGRFWSLVPFSAAELLCLLAALAFLVFLVWTVLRFRRADYKRDVLYAHLLGFFNVLLSLLAAFFLLWGVNYHADGLKDRLTLRTGAVETNDLARVTRYFAAQADLYAGFVPRDANGVCALSREAAMELAPTLYETMYAEFPFLDVGEDYAPKPLLLSRVMSAMGFTGFYFPFTGESNLNMDHPCASFPATIAHELAHRRGIASEQECNFLAVLASTRAESDAYRYSGWLLGYIHLSNALSEADPALWREISSSLSPAVQTDLRDARDYWAQYESRAVARVSEGAYDTLLRTCGDELGMRSYGAVVELLVAYFK